MRLTRCQHLCANLGPKGDIALAHQIDAPYQIDPIHHDLDQIAVAHFANRTTSERLRPDVANTCACANSGKACIREQRDLLAPG